MTHSAIHREFQSNLAFPPIVACLFVLLLFPVKSKANSDPSQASQSEILFPHRTSRANLIFATKTTGVRTISKLRIRRGKRGTTLGRAIRVLGPPSRISQPYEGVCFGFFGRGLRLTALSSGAITNCGSILITRADVRSSYWRVKVGARSYRVGMSAARIPNTAEKVPGLGYRLAFIGSRLGSVYAKVGSAGRIRAFVLYLNPFVD